MSKKDKIKNKIPNPFEPGEFVSKKFTEKYQYESRWASYEKVAKLVQDGKYSSLTPVFSEFIPTLECPFRCPTCSYRLPKEKIRVWKQNSVPKGIVEMKPEQARMYLDKLKQGGCQAILLTGGGEPTAYPYLKEIVEHAKKLKLRISMSTNGTFVQKNFKPEDAVAFGFDNIRISLDTIEKHASFHGYDKSKKDWCKIVLGNIERIAKTKIDLSTDNRLTICVIYDERNYKEIPELGQKIAGFKAVNWIVIRPVINYFGKKQVPGHIIQATKEFVEEKLKKSLSRSKIKIAMPEHRIVSSPNTWRQYAECRACGLIGGVWPDGRMFICTETNGFDDFCIGNLSRQTLKEIYSSNKYNNVRLHVGRKNFQTCPVTCRPTKLNLVFEKIEKLRAEGKTAFIREWINALKIRHKDPCPWIQA